MPAKRDRARPGSKGGGEFFRIEVRPADHFETFRHHDVGQKGGIERLAGKHKSGGWATQAWLISKQDAHVDGDRLVPDSDDAREVIDALGSTPVHREGDIFTAQDRPNVPERAKPTDAQERARRDNLRKAQAARWKNRG